MQPILIIYFDIIIEKMIAEIFIIMNNKTEERYLDSFKYIKYYINRLNKNINNPRKIKLLQ